MTKNIADLIIIGGGLAGSEAALQAADIGLNVTLYEMRPNQTTGAHVTANLAELVCSNSLGSNIPNRASGLLKAELSRLGSKLIEIARQTAVPAGGALAVDRVAFSRQVTEMIEGHPNIHLIREEITEIPDTPTIIASGPLTSQKLSEAIAKLTGHSHLYFFDAIAPIVYSDSIDFRIAYKGSRYGRGESNTGDYINCPMNYEEYQIFTEELVHAERIELKIFEKDIDLGVQAGNHKFFEGCLPIEVLARRGKESLAFGPLRPVGLENPHTGKRPYAVIQLRQDNLADTLYNIVGFQTNLTFSEQKRIFRLIPGLKEAIFERYGQMHRNTFIFSPDLLDPTLQFRAQPKLFFSGQITGVEGYAGNIATGLLAGINASRMIKRQPLLTLPPTTMLGALCHYITHASTSDFQPMKANFGLLPSLEFPKSKKTGRNERNQIYAERAMKDLDNYLVNLHI